MDGLMKINDVAARYDVSTRTLRFYEEMGILASVQPEPGKPRYYTPEAVRRLEQILALRRLQTPLREIERIFTLTDPAEALDSFVQQLRALEQAEKDLQERRRLLENLLKLFRWEEREHHGTLPEEIVALAEQSVEIRRNGGWHPADLARQRLLTDVRIVELKPMRMARYHDPVAPSCFDSWRHMIGWAIDNDLPTIRAFGYTSPNPEGIRPMYGYDVLFALPDGYTLKGHLEAIQFEGGLYAAIPTWYENAGPDWRSLDRWVKTHPEYEGRPGLRLEELNDFRFPVTRDSMVDLLYPIQPRRA